VLVQLKGVVPEGRLDQFEHAGDRVDNAIRLLAYYRAAGAPADSSQAGEVNDSLNSQPSPAVRDPSPGQRVAAGVR
jgi:hypothetical protein